MNTALAILCAGSVAFMLWFLVVLVKESRAAAWPRPLKTYVAKHRPSGRMGNVVVMNPKARDRKRAVGRR